MIPQRNISLLANRLVREGGRRIPDEVLERDYCLAWFLAALAQSDLRATLGFKGGTALKRCYFGDYRFSEDLDFTLTATATLDELKARLEPVYAAVRDASGIVFAFDREDRQKHENTYAFYLRYEGPLPRGNDVKVDITLREKLVHALQERPVLRGYEELRTFPKTGFCAPILWRRSLQRKLSPSLIGHATNPEISTICGISRQTKESISARLPMECGRSWSFEVSHATVWPRQSAQRKQG